MATAYHASTPSPPPSSSIRTPPTPKHGGFSDSWEPYSPRKSARIASQRTAHRTPSPQSSRRNRTPTHNSRKAASSTTSIMSPTETPQKKRFPATESARRTSGTLTSEGTTSAAHFLGLDKQQAKQEEESRTSTITRRSGMLPTPVKTPKKAPTEAQAASIRAVARNLFAHEEETSIRSPRKQRVPKRYNGISMESFVAEEVEEPIPIFTDSQDRIPEVDTSAENPFYGNHTTAAPEPPRRRSKRRVAVPGEGSQQVEEALQREDGMVYVFRGKKIFRKFTENEEDDADNADPSRVPLTRSSIKPRRLFQEQIQQVSPEDEEAVTDIEDHHMEEVDEHDEEDMPQTPVEDKSAHGTPRAPRFAPAPTPPDTRRTTRFGTKGEESTPSKPKTGRLFDNWPITKSRSSSAEVSHKRAAESSLESAPPSKRARA